jgi:hypothetical protein
VWCKLSKRFGTFKFNKGRVVLNINMCLTKFSHLIKFCIVLCVAIRIPSHGLQIGGSMDNGAMGCQVDSQQTGCTVDYKTDDKTWSVIESLRQIYEDYQLDCKESKFRCISYCPINKIDNL